MKESHKKFLKEAGAKKTYDSRCAKVWCPKRRKFVKCVVDIEAKQQHKRSKVNPFAVCRTSTGYKGTTRNIGIKQEFKGRKVPYRFHSKNKQEHEKASTKKLKALVIDEKNASKEYKKLGFSNIAKDELKHQHLLERELREEGADTYIKPGQRTVKTGDLRWSRPVIGGKIIPKYQPTSNKFYRDYTVYDSKANKQKHIYEYKIGKHGKIHRSTKPFY